MTEPADPELDRLTETIFQRYHYDFRSYEKTSLQRRVTTAVAHFGCGTIPNLIDRILSEPKDYAVLMRFLTVQVSDMFRDPSYFRTVREKVVPYLRTYPSLKLWVAGCSTGEEAYSLAIVLAEEDLLERTLIYATDIHLESLRIAKQGVYDVERVAGFSEGYRLAGGRASLSDYYTAQYSSAVFNKTLRKSILFADHSLATDSAFAEVELVSCRNVLIYFGRELQNRTVGLLRDSLCRKGFLGLGQKETLRFSAHATAFTEFDPGERIYQKS